MLYLLKLWIMALGRPSEYDYDLCIEICDLLADGDNIKRILNTNEDYPNWTTFRRWKQVHNELSTLYVNSQQDKAIAYESELDDLKDMLLAKEIDSSTYNVLVQTIKWKMAKFYPKVFGDKVQQEHSGEIKTTPSAINVRIIESNDEE